MDEGEGVGEGGAGEVGGYFRERFEGGGFSKALGNSSIRSSGERFWGIIIVV